MDSWNGFHIKAITEMIKSNGMRSSSNAENPIIEGQLGWADVSEAIFNQQWLAIENRYTPGP